MFVLSALHLPSLEVRQVWLCFLFSSICQHNTAGLDWHPHHRTPVSTDPQIHTLHILSTGPLFPLTSRSTASSFSIFSRSHNSARSDAVSMKLGGLVIGTTSWNNVTDTHTADGTHTHTGYWYTHTQTADGTHTHTGYWYTHTHTADGTHTHTGYWYTHTQTHTERMVHIHTQAIGTHTQIHTQRMVHIHTQAIGTLTHRQLMVHTVYWYTHTQTIGTLTHRHTHSWWYTYTHRLLVHSHTDSWWYTQTTGTLTHTHTHTHTHRWLDLNSHTPITAWTSSKHSLQSTLCARVHRLLVHSHSWHTYTHTYSWYTHTHTAGKVTQQWYKATLLANYSDSTGTQAVQKGWRQHWHTGCVERTKTALAHRLFRKDTDKPEVCVSTGTQAV